MAWLFVLIIAIDQITKRLATYYFYRNVFFSYYGFSNTLVNNRGISFSIFADYKYFFLLKYFVLIGVFFLIYFLKKSKDRFESLALILILSGGVSNLLDRCFFGGVVDFLVVKFFLIPEFICNFADCMINLGAFLLIIRIILDFKNR